VTPQKEYKSAKNVNSFVKLPYIFVFLLLENFWLLHAFVDGKTGVDAYRSRI